MTDQMLQEKQSGLRAAWERLYKQAVNTFMLKEAKDGATHKPEDFLLELEELDNDWKLQASSENVSRESHNGLIDGSVEQIDAV